MSPSTIAKRALGGWCQTYHRTGTFLYTYLYSFDGGYSRRQQWEYLLGKLYRNVQQIISY